MGCFHFWPIRVILLWTFISKFSVDIGFYLRLISSLAFVLSCPWMSLRKVSTSLFANCVKIDHSCLCSEIECGQEMVWRQKPHWLLLSIVVNSWFGGTSTFIWGITSPLKTKEKREFSFGLSSASSFWTNNSPWAPYSHVWIWVPYFFYNRYFILCLCSLFRYVP